MARVVVDVMLKPEILDPQGQAVIRALPSLDIAGTAAVAGVRIGKHVEIEIADGIEIEDGGEGNGGEGNGGMVDPAALGAQIADRLLANPVIEDFTVRTA